MEASPNRLKAQVNNANGGIGVSYSNVVLAGGMDVRGSPGGPISTAKQMQVNQPAYPPQYAKGLDFNAKQKYDFNILNG